MAETPIYDELRAATALAAGPVEHVHRVRASHPSWAEPVDLDVEAARVTFDEAWSPHVQAEISATIPDADVLDMLDPRAGVRLELEAGYRYGDGTEDVHPLADLGLRLRVVNRPDNVLQLEAAGDEMTLQDNLWTSSTPAPLPRTGLLEAVSFLVDQGAGGGTTLDSEIPAGYRPELLTEAELPAGEDYWRPAAGMVDDAEAWLYDDGTRTWRLRKRPTVAGKARAQLATGPAGTLTRTTSRLDRDTWANAVYLRSTWRDSAGTERIVHARAYVNTGPHAAGSAGWKWTRIDRTTPTTPAGASAAAAAILRRIVTRGRGQNVSGVAMYWLRPGMTVTTQLPTGSQERQLVGRVEFDLVAGGMAVATRQPDDVSVTTGE